MRNDVRPLEPPNRTDRPGPGFGFWVVILLVVTFGLGVAGLGLAQEYTKGRSQASFVKSKMIDGRPFVEFPAQIQSPGGGWSPVTISVEHEVWLAVDAKVRTDVEQSGVEGPRHSLTLRDTVWRAN